MKPIGIFYAKNTAKTKLAANMIKEAFGETYVKLIPVEDVVKQDFEEFDNMIAGVSTWFDGELPTYWDEIVPLLSTVNLKDKKVAIFGLGDQVNYPDNFVDGIGLLADIFQKSGAKIIGTTSPEGYTFSNSLGFRDGKFLGLPLDFDNQDELSNPRIQSWIEQLKKDFFKKSDKK